MKLCLFTIVTLFVAFSHCQLIKRAYPTFPKCDQNLLSSIKTYWNTVGKPKNVLQTLTENSPIILHHTSYNYLTSVMKCVYVKFSKESLTAMLIPNNGKPPLNMSYTAEQDEDGVIRGSLMENHSPEYGWNWYTIYLDNGITACYVCSDVAGSQNSALMNIMLVKKDKALLNSTKVSDLYKTLEGWGIQFNHNYGEECIVDE